MCRGDHTVLLRNDIRSGPGRSTWHTRKHPIVPHVTLEVSPHGLTSLVHSVNVHTHAHALNVMDYILAILTM